MRISGIFFMIVLSMTFEYTLAWWAVAARGIEPIILSIGSAFAALSLNDKLSDDLYEYDKKGRMIWDT